MGVLTDIAGKIPSSLQCEGKNVSKHSKQRIKSFRTRERRYMALTWNCLNLSYQFTSPFSVTRPYFHSAKNIILVL